MSRWINLGHFREATGRKGLLKKKVTHRITEERKQLTLLQACPYILLYYKPLSYQHETGLLQKYLFSLGFRFLNDTIAGQPVQEELL